LALRKRCSFPASVLIESIQYSETWPTTVGSVCIVVGGLSLFGGCLSLTGMSEIEQLYSAVPFGEGEMNEEIILALSVHAPPAWMTTFGSMLVILFSLALTFFGASLLQRSPGAVLKLKCWSVLYIVFTLLMVIINWVPRVSLIESESTVKGLLLAQLTISIPLYLVLPIFLLFFLNSKKVRNELLLWR